MKQKNFETVLYSTAGVLAMFVVLLAFYVITGAVKARVDLTADKVYTLSPGTKKILSRLDTPVTIRFYATQSDNNPQLVPLKAYAQRIDDLLSEYKQASHGKIKVEKYDPTPDSDAEDQAHLNGIDGQPTSPMGGDKFYMGLAVSMLDEKVAIPWLSPDREKLLEYDISRAIARVINPKPATVGVMSALPVFGNQMPPQLAQRMGRQNQDPYIFVSELKKDFTVKEVPMTTEKIDEDINVLVVVHPRDISDTAQYAIDQFVLRGGHLLAFLDPHAYFDQKQDQMSQVIGESSGQSSMDKLLRGWGLEMDINKVAADMTFGNTRGQSMPTVLMLPKTGINQDDTATSQADSLVMAFPGVFTGKPADGLKETVLLQTSPRSQLVDGVMSSIGGDQIMKDFKESGTNYALAVRLTGKFKTAFLGGKPKKADAKDDKDKLADTDKSLKESTKEGAVILVADSDMLNDQVCVQVQDIMGYKLVQPKNGNLALVQSFVENLGGDSDLISMRSRASVTRPFTKLQDMEAQANQKWQAKLKEMEEKKQETERKISELQQKKEGAQQKFILSPEQQKELENFRKANVDINKQLKQLRKDLRRDTDTLQFRTKMVNIFAMPVAVAFAGVALALVKRKKTAAK
ncbi:MAG: Gldg family protein [Limisphaerales bacterium]